MSGERIIPQDFQSQHEYLIYLKEMFVYSWCASVIRYDSVCLDLGCAEGFGTKELAGVLRKVVGIDIDKKSIERAASKYAGPSCSFMHYEAGRLPFSDCEFDAVVSLHVIEHISDAGHFLRDIERVLKPNGILILTTPNRALRLPKGGQPFNIHHVKEYDGFELKEALSDYFTGIDIMGLCADEEVLRVEEKRIKQLNKIASYDIFNLRRRLPAVILKPIITLIHFLRSRQKGDFPDSLIEKIDGYGPGLFRIDNVYRSNSLDIIALCKKQ
ncbi:MAG: class I SAM-dependent methyltransferase [Candidatus Omnitrophota bacterium]